MSLKDLFKQQQSGMEAMATTGLIGMHLVSGPLVGFALGYGLDHWLNTGPWGKLIFLFVGISAGFLNVYRDTQRLLKKIARDDATRMAAGIPNQQADRQERVMPHAFAQDLKADVPGTTTGHAPGNALVDVRDDLPETAASAAGTTPPSERNPAQATAKKAGAPELRPDGGTHVE